MGGGGGTAKQPDKTEKKNKPGPTEYLDNTKSRENRGDKVGAAYRC